MITNITLSKFKAFLDLPALELRPITILCGTNSCGKSSILQSILLAKQTAEGEAPQQKLLLNGRYAHLGTFDNIIHGKEPKGSVTLKFNFSFDRTSPGKSKRGAMPLFFYIRDLFPRHIVDHNTNTCIGSISITYKAMDRPLHPGATCAIERYEFSVALKKENGEIQDGAKFTINATAPEKFMIEWERVPNRYSISHKAGSEELTSGKTFGRVTFSNLAPVNIEAQRGDDEDAQPLRLPAFHRISLITQHIFAGVTYIGPLRDEPARRYIFDNEVLEIGSKGENAAYLLLNEESDIVDGHYITSNDERSFLPIPPRPLGEITRIWLSKMGINKFGPELSKDIVHLNLESNASQGTTVSIADVGFGVSQIFPIILEGVRMPRGGTLLLEQPEIHLHPKLQMELGDFFISLAHGGRNIIAETHSDHLINRLVRRIIEDETGKLAKLINIYFISNTEIGSIATPIEVSPTRGITNWPVDFFDQAANEQELIMRALSARYTQK